MEGTVMLGFSWLISLCFIPLADVLILFLCMRSASARRIAVFALMTPLMQAALLLWHYGDVMNGGDVYVLLRLQEFNFTVRLYADPLAWWFAFLVAVMSALVFWYVAVRFQDDAAQLRASYRHLLFLDGCAMLTMLTDNLLLLSVSWVLVDASVFLGGLRKQENVRGAFKALFAVAGGSVALFAGVALLWRVVGSVNITEFQGIHFHAYPWATIIAFCFLAGAGVLSAQPPFHFLLMRVLSASLPASIYMQSVVINLGIYFIARMQLLGALWAWHTIILICGITTYAWGGFVALRQTDLRVLLAYSTVSQIGFIMALLAGVGGEAVIPAAVFYMANHAISKTCLLFASGAIKQNAGAQNLLRLGGLGRRMPWVFLPVGVCALSLAGIPLFGGFFANGLLFEISWRIEWNIVWFTVLLGSIFTFLYAAKILVALFGTAAMNDGYPVPHVPKSIQMSLWTLAGFALVLGTLPYTFVLREGVSGSFFMHMTIFIVGVGMARKLWARWPEVAKFLRQKREVV